MLYLSVEVSPYSKTGEYSIKFKQAFYNFFGYIDSSYNVFNARILGLSWAQYLRYERDTYGARIVGTKQKYPSLYYPTQESANAAAKEIDKRLLKIITGVKKLKNEVENSTSI